MKIPPPTPLFDTLAYCKETVTEHAFPNDLAHARTFLYSYRGSTATYNAYRRELERLLQWSAHILKKPLHAIKRQDIETYIEFCQHPPTQWIGTHQCKRFVVRQGERVANRDWRPFVTTQTAAGYTLSEKATQAIFAVLSSFYQYLIQEDYLDYNPVAQIRQKSKYIRKHQGKPIIRRLSEKQWTYVVNAAQDLAKEDPARHERTLFIMSALYSMYLRISELCTSARWRPTMGDFYKDHEEHWWFRTVGKGNKERHIAVSDAMLDALKRYRRFLGLSSLPHPGEQTPLISKINTAHPITSTRQIRSIVQGCFDAATIDLVKDGHQEEADQLQSATVHWLRHTGISDDVKHRPREHVRDDAGHGSSAITDKYIDVELRARHASNREKRLVPED